MENQHINSKPQRDIPVEVIVHYIVKDYQRMFLTYDEVEKRAESAEATIEKLKKEHLKELK